MKDVAESFPEVIPLETSSRPNSQGIQVAVTAFIVMFCTVGLTLWGLPYYYDFMVRQFGWTRSQVTSGNAVSKILFGPAFGFLAGWMVDRVGPRRVMMTGIVIASVALIGLGTISSLRMFYFFYVLNALGFLCGGPLPNQVLLAERFETSRGKAMAVAYLGIGVGGVSVPWISNFLVQNFGWQAALRSLGLIILVLAFPAAYFVKDATGDANLSRRASKRRVPISIALRTAPFYLLVAGSVFSVAAISGVQQNLKLFLVLDNHYTQVLAARFLSLIMAFSIVGRLAMGWLADRIHPRNVMILVYCLIGAAIPIIVLHQSPLSLYIFAAVFGIALGGDYLIISLVTAEIFSMELLGRLLSIILAAQGLAESGAPWIIGYIRDARGSYLPGFVVLDILAFAAVLTGLLLPKQKKTA
ncbi:MAG TPA: MFS transporter [Alloacidobacterium sp.]|nr:MFS transporter [Alloacidobacterium sp.]